MPLDYSNAGAGALVGVVVDMHCWRALEEEMRRICEGAVQTANAPISHEMLGVAECGRRAGRRHMGRRQR